MGCDYHLLPHVGIQTLTPYVPGKPLEELAREQGLKDIIKLASNENPLGAGHKAQEALAKLSSREIASYPSPINHPLLKQLGDKLTVPTNMLILSNGSDFLFSLILLTFALQRGSMLTHQYAFLSYQIQAQTLGIPFKLVALKSNWQVDIEALIKESQYDTAVIFLANPNNPTGALISLKDIKMLLANIPASTILVIDEAYYEYAYPEDDASSINLLQQYPNLILTRTFSKAYGLAGLRLGYAIAMPKITELLLRAQLPFTVNQAALDAASAALTDRKFIQATLEVNYSGRKQLQAGLEALHLDCLPADGNFVTFNCNMDALPIYQALLTYGIIVRPLHQYQLANYLRVTIGTLSQNQRFLDGLKRCLASQNN